MLGKKKVTLVNEEGQMSGGSGRGGICKRREACRNTREIGYSIGGVGKVHCKVGSWTQMICGLVGMDANIYTDRATVA